MRRSLPRYFPAATGGAGKTAQAHQEPEHLTLWAAWIFPVSFHKYSPLEEKAPNESFYKTEEGLKEAIPALQVGDKPIHESTIVCEYLEEAFPDNLPLLPRDPLERAQARVWIDYINNVVVPSFFRLLEAQPTETEEFISALDEFKDALGHICVQRRGRFFLGDEFSLVDVAMAPWAVRDFLLREYRGFGREDIPGDWEDWASALESRPSVYRTTSLKSLYVEYNQVRLQNASEIMIGGPVREEPALGSQDEGWVSKVRGGY
ncbi:MAG: hypothetical protein M1820_009524 [Bogoriella megaspora]|nr:MAG: hypothetical protein M1820_009524 [Bogoriella megaspora]